MSNKVMEIQKELERRFEINRRTSIDHNNTIYITLKKNGKNVAITKNNEFCRSQVEFLTYFILNYVEFEDDYVHRFVINWKFICRCENILEVAKWISEQ